MQEHTDPLLKGSPCVKNYVQVVRRNTTAEASQRGRSCAGTASKAPRWELLVTASSMRCFASLHRAYLPAKFAGGSLPSDPMQQEQQTTGAPAGWAPAAQRDILADVVYQT